MKFTTLFKSTSIALAITAAAGQESLCNPSSKECYAFKPIRDPAKLVFNLENAFARNHTITYMHRGGIEFKRFKLTFPEDGEDYRWARDTGSYYNRGRVPAAIVYAESEEDVVKAVKSATDAGYNIAPRGRGHQYQGLSTMDGYVVIDCSLLCDPDSFEIEKNLDFPWILPNQRMIGSIKAGAGCTNAVLLGSAHQHFADEGGVYQVGTCPSVGIVGYSTGGGSGDTTPWIGWGADDVLEYEVILYDGTNVTANANENKDLFWALSGGGSGLGVITKIKTGVIQSPEPRPGQDRKFSYGSFQALIDTDEKREEFWGAFQDFLYDSPEDDANAKFGANMGSIDNLFGMSFIFLGGIGEAVDILNRYHLLKYPSSDTMPQVCFSNYQNCSAVDLPSQITRIYEFNTYGEAMLYKICQTTEVYLGMTNVSYPGDAYPDDGVCDALGLDQSKCPFQGLLPTPESCLDPDVIASLQRAVSDPLSFMNRPFYPDRGQNPNVPQNGADGPMEFTSRGGLLLPKLEASTWAKLSKGTNFTANHLQHGAPTKRTEDYIAYPFRQHAILFDMTTANVPNLDFFMSTILEDPYYNNDKKKLSGYFNYMNPVGNPDWRDYYFKTNYERLTEIKREYDPWGIFSLPNGVEASSAAPSTGPGNDDEYSPMDDEYDETDDVPPPTSRPTAKSGKGSKRM